LLLYIIKITAVDVAWVVFDDSVIALMVINLVSWSSSVAVGVYDCVVHSFVHFAHQQDCAVSCGWGFEEILVLCGRAVPNILPVFYIFFVL